MSRRLDIPDSLRRDQSRASDPTASAWVSANAGSGKTHVLAQRVLRLLIDGAKPSQILCLTFTKAAAANMAARVFRALAEWTSLDDDRLTEKILETGAGRPGPPELAFARQLFARTIETPGGLKIQTLHAFCERLLRLFPFEANVPAHFAVVEEREAATLMGEARVRAMAVLKASPESAAALDRVAREAGVFVFEDLLLEARGFAATFAAFADAPSFRDALRVRLGVPERETAASVEEEMLGGDIRRGRRLRWAQGLEGGHHADREMAACLRDTDAPGDRADRAQALLTAFFTKKGEDDPRGGEKGHLTGKKLRDRQPDLEKELQRELSRLTGLRDRRRAAETLERSVAVFAVASAILKAYAEIKDERGALDFADQISRALALVTRSSAAWVMHKLDYGLDHLLIDEAQDNSAEQWRIVEKLTDEFFAGAGARSRLRTVFAVGDEKQSIFSFQGAAPEWFAHMRRHFERRHRDAGKPFHSVPLHYSFRSSPTILSAVDRVFAEEAAWRGVAFDGDEAPAHEAIHTALQGVVEIWPAIAAEKPPDPDDWTMPLDEPASHAPAVILAGRIADEIRRFVAPGSPDRIVDLKSRIVRPVRPGDVMILVRRRNAFFEAMIRALKTRGIKAAGADRLRLHDHIAVMDLVAAGRAALTRDDDLTLATLLKSPLVGLDDDALYALAAERKGALDGALAASEDKRFAEPARRVAEWRRRAESLGPYDFYARILGEDGGRRALLGRLGEDARDPIDEFLALALAHERREAPSLTRFLAEIEADEAEIKRDLEAESEGVRVLTVHASKGLEAPIVFLPDTTGAPGGAHDPKLMPLPAHDPEAPPLFAWTRRKAEDCAVVAAAREAAQRAQDGEHRRLLYVAMTRAAERLIVCGYETLKGAAKGCWHGLVSESLAEMTGEAPAPWDEGETIRRYGAALKAGGEGGSAPAGGPATTLPVWLRSHAPEETLAPRRRPSDAAASEDGAERRAEGVLAHALLERLPRLEPDRRRSAALSFMEAEGEALSEERRAALVDEVLAVIGRPELADLFGPGSRGEVSFEGVVRHRSRTLAVSGRLDRLAVTEAGVFLADFKLGRAPARPNQAHVEQLALYAAALESIYPGRPLDVALIYLEGPHLRKLSQADLLSARDALLTL